MVLALFFLALVNVCKGSVSFSFREIWSAFSSSVSSGAESGLDSSSVMMIKKVVWNIRLPRILSAVLLGGALSLSGFLLQTFFGNPIAGPYVLGISSGAKLFLS